MHVRRFLLLFRTFLPLIIVVMFFGVLLFGVRKQSESLYFQDETDHVAVGWMITNFHRTLYENLSTNHQPIPVFVGAVLAKQLKYATLFELISMLRMSMWFFAFVTSIGIVARFRYRGLIATILIYSIGHYFFSWYVLAESLSVPAIVWMLLSLFEHKQTRLDAMLVGVSAFWMAFCLLPLWPCIGLASGYYVIRSKARYWAFLAIGFIVPTLVLFTQIHVGSWWQETVINNIQYFIPYTSSDHIGYLQILVYPLVHFGSLQNFVSRFYIFGILIALSYWYICARKKPWNVRRIVHYGVVFVLLYVLNLRVSEPHAIFYHGFHLFPYIAGFSVLIAIMITKIYENSRESKKLRTLAILCFGILMIVLNNTVWVTEKKDQLTEYYIQYNPYQQFATVLHSISGPKDTLMTGQDGAGYMNMMSNLPFADRQNFHLQWAYRVPYLRTAWLSMLHNNPPTFIYFDLGSDGYSQTLRPLLITDYVSVWQKDGTPTLLHIQKKKVPSISADQWRAFTLDGYTLADPTQPKHS